MRYIVLHHSPDIPQDQRSSFYEGRWFDATQFPVVGPVTLQTGRKTDPHAYAEPADGRVEYRDDGEAAEVWEIHLIEP